MSSVTFPTVGTARLPPRPPLSPPRGASRGRQRTLRPTWPSAAVEAGYRARLTQLIDEMARSVVYWVTAARRKEEPRVSAMAMDDFASAILARAMRQLRRLWYRRFDQAAKRLAEYFGKSVADRTDGQLKKILQDAGISVKFDMSPAQRDVLAAVVNENVSLIRTIPRKYLDQVEGHVMRSVATGRDLKQLTDDLHGTFYASRKYAAFVAKDQNNKATAALQRARYLENGIKTAIWMHSSAGKTPRPSHVKAGRDKIEFNVGQGWYDPHEEKFILPGQLINCRCTMRPVVAGFQ